MSAQLPRREHFINGEWVPPASGEYFPSVNPATGEAFYEAARGNAEDVDRAVAAASAAFENPTWRRMTQTQRGKLLRKLADLIGEHGDELARTETLDNGKLLREMQGQMKSLPEYYYYYAGLADKIHGEVIPSNLPDILNYTLREPLGVVGAISPWNSPLMLTTTKMAPALATGNTLVIKPSEYTSASLLALVPLFEEAGFPPGVVNVVTGFGREAGAPLVDHPGVKKMSFTGSTATGAAIARSCGERFVKVTLELGGKSPNIVFPDADLDSASMGVVAGIFAAAGQTCVAGSRAFVHRDVYDEVIERVTQRAASIRIGDPMVAETELGPLAFADQLAKVESYVKIGQDEGGRLVQGGQRADVGLGGYFFEPTVFVDMQNDMRICQEEIFGPVLSLIPFSSEDEVLKLANDTQYGLASAVFSRNVPAALDVARRIESGICHVNSSTVHDEPQMPFGGVKSSGWGRFGGKAALEEFTELRWMSIQQTSRHYPI